jgi:hypothetical protein
MTRRVTFSETDAGRISKAVRAHERGNRDQSPVFFRQVGDEGGGIQLAAYSTNGGEWSKGDTAYVHDHEINENYQIIPKYKGDGTPQYTLVINLFSTLPPNYDAVRYCAYTKIGAVNVLIAAEC